MNGLRPASLKRCGTQLLAMDSDIPSTQMLEAEDAGDRAGFRLPVWVAVDVVEALAPGSSLDEVVEMLELGRHAVLRVESGKREARFQVLAGPAGDVLNLRIATIDAPGGPRVHVTRRD